MRGWLSGFGHLYSGFWTISAGVLFCGLSSCEAHAQVARTVTWFADRPAEMARTLEACRDDPGRLRHAPDCINAHQAQYVVAERQARALPGAAQPDRPPPGDLTPPSSPRYWVDRPAERRRHLLYCSRMQPAEQARVHCDVALNAVPLQAEVRPR